MIENPKKSSNLLTIAIHSTDNSFGFAYRKNNNHASDTFFIKKLNNDLCNNLVIDFKNFISKEKLQKTNKISVSIGPGNFNASRLIVVLARTISQQINCPIESYSTFSLMSKRVALENNIFENNQSFWIYKQLKRRGYIAGKYQVRFSKTNKELQIKEKITPKVIENLGNTEPNFLANYDEKLELTELLNLSNRHLEIQNSKSWKTVLPLYITSPIN